ncbi:MAG TPA: pitrilysin family protein [Burkholderiaceae bacterium]|nr:pitrilysin family protein [Burkholderiaceae bacterium]
MIRLFPLVCLVSALVAWTPADARTANAPAKIPAGVVRGAQVEGVTEYRLANGLQVLLFPDPSKPTATVNITYLVGSRFENYGETGMAHLLEHLIFKGSKHYPDPDKEFSRRGFHNNASTWIDRTNFFSTFQASDDNLRWALGWTADAMTQSFIAKKDLDSEMTVVRNEFEMGENDPSRVLFQHTLATMFDWHNYGHPTIGNRSDIENVRIENLQAFYRLYYQPDNAVLIVAGRFDEAKTLGWIVEYFGRIARPTRKLPVFWTVEPTQDGERDFTVRRHGDQQLALLAYHVPSSLHPDSDALGVAAEILGNTPNGRLHKELVETGLAAQVFSYGLTSRDPGALMFGVVVKKGDSLEKARDRLIEVVESTFAKLPPTAEELDRVRKDSDNGYERALSNPEEFAVGLSESIALGDWRLFFLERDKVASVTSADVVKVAEQYFRRDNRTVGLFIPDDKPQRAEIPPAPTPSQRLAEFKPRAGLALGEAFEPSQDNIDRRTRRVDLGDLKLALLPKKTRGETVNVSMAFRYGDVSSLTGQSVNALLADLMLARGTDKLTRQQIADEMTRLKMTGGIRSFQTTRANLADALRLSFNVLRNASFPSAEFDQLKRELITTLQGQANDPAERSRDALQTHFNVYPAGDPRYYMPLAERIEEIQKASLDDVRRFHANFFGTSRGEIAIVGDFDDRAVEPLLRELYPGWVSRAPYARVLQEPRDIAPTRIFIDTPDKENAFYRARMNITLRDDDPDYAPLQLANYIFGGGGGLASRLIDRVRQREGLSYGAGSSLIVHTHDRASAWQIGGLVAPQNSARFEQAVREEIDRMLKDGFTQKEIDDARNGLLQERLVTRSEDAAVAAGWVAYLDAGRTFAFSKQFEDRIRTLTPDDVIAAARRNIDPARLTVVIAGDAKKGAR